jgi:putative methionine-R-sulfoxide reductase with GAF domain
MLLERVKGGMMTSDVSQTEKMYLRLFETISANEVKDNGSKISEWIKRHYKVDAIGFLLQDNGPPSSYFTKQTAKEIVQKFAEAFQQAQVSQAAKNNFLIFGRKGGTLSFFSQPEDIGSVEPMGHMIALTIHDRLIGSLLVFTKALSIQGITPDIPDLRMFIPSISHLIQNCVAHEQKNKKIRRLNLYQTVSSALSYIGDLHELLTTIVTIVTTELNCEECSILLYDEESNELEFFTAIGDTGMNLGKVRFPADRGIAGKALRERKTQIVNDAQKHPDFYSFFDENYDFKTKSILAAPILSGDVLVGVISAINKIGDRHFNTEDDQTLSAIADEVALAVKNAKLFDFVVDSYCNIRKGLSSCQGCKRPLKFWTPCVKYLNLS